MHQLRDPELVWAASKAAFIIVSAFASLVGLAWVAYRATSPK